MIDWNDIAQRRKYGREYYYLHKKEQQDRNLKNYKLNIDLYRAYDKKRKYGISWDEYINLHEEQKWLCAICGKVQERKALKHYREGSYLEVDHNHKCCSGKITCGKCIRGLLCGRCNRKLAVLEDEEFFTKAVEYLNRYK